MGLGSWIGRRLVNSTLKEYDLTSDDLKNLVPLVKQIKQARNSGGNDGKGGERGPNQVSTTGFEGGGEGDEGETTTGDAILDRYYELLSRATDKKEILALGDSIQERELFLRRSEQNRANRRGGGGRKEEGPEEEAPAKPELDIRNLAPHADDIASEIVGWLGTSGVLPKELADSAKGVVSTQIKAHPDLVVKGLDVLNGVLSKYAGSSRGQGEQQAQGQGEGVDLQHPEKWAGQLGYG